MKLVVGGIYTVLKSDSSLITFKFLGDEPPVGEIQDILPDGQQGKILPLHEILKGGFLAYWQKD